MSGNNDEDNILNDFFGEEEGEKKVFTDTPPEKEQTDTPPEKEERADKEVVVEEEKTPEKPKKNNKKKSGGVNDRIVEHLKERLNDQDFVSSENLSGMTCRRIGDIILMLEENDGEWVEGRKSLDNFVIKCPIYNYAPMSLCYKCESWIGENNPEGVCKRDIEDVDPASEKFDIHSARNEEIRLRREARLEEESRTDDSEEV